MSRPLWFDVNGKRPEMGYCEMLCNFGARHIKTVSKYPVDGESLPFQMIEDQLIARGYTPGIYKDGKILLTIPQGDKYGWIFREIARTYYLAHMLYVPPVDANQTQLTEAE